MTEIETGEYFVVTRGFAHNIQTFGHFFWSDFSQEPQKDKPQKYDKSYEGCVFVALEACGPAVAAKCVYADRWHKDTKGKLFSLNLTDIEVMPVTQKYIDALSPKTEAAEIEVDITEQKEICK